MLTAILSLSIIDISEANKFQFIKNALQTQSIFILLRKNFKRFTFSKVYDIL